ncbi:MAG TPA: hypothetical protein VK661_07710, partial [Planctomycetota bacterium]|nr:hypothetical protein [Planctomycetota bacterium]
FFSAWVRAGRVLDVQRKAVPERVAALRSQRVLRPNLFDPAEEGNAWELETRALEALAALPAEDLEGFPSFSGDEHPNPDPAKIESTLKKIRPQIEDLKHALRRRWVEPNYRYEEHVGLKMPHLSQAIRMGKLLRDGAVYLHGEGKLNEAVDFIVLGLGLADHIVVKGSLVPGMVGIVVRSCIHEALRKILAAHHLDTASLQRLARTLDLLESAEPNLNECLRVDDLFTRLVILDLVDHQLKGVGDFTAGASFRHWFSLRIMMAESVEAQDRFMEGVERVSVLPLWERPAAGRDVLAPFEHHPTAIHALMLPQLGRAWRNAAECSMEHKLARLAVALAMHQAEHGTYPAKLADLVPRYLSTLTIDPYAGQPFGYSVTAGAAVVYSFGEDRDDDGGRPVPDDDIDGDVVWTVKRLK